MPRNEQQTRFQLIDPRRSPELTFRYIDITSVDNVRKRITEPRMLIGREAPSRARQRIATGDVLVATTRPNLNAVALVPPELNGQVASTGFCVLRPADELDADYLFAFVQSGTFIQSLSDLVKGALYPAVSDNQVFLQTIPFPPLRTQRRIATQLKAQLAEVDHARAALQAQIDTTNTLIAAILRESLTSTATAKCQIADCLQEVTQGIGTKWRDYPVLGATRAGLAPAKEGVGKAPERYKPVRVGTVFYNPMRILLGSIAMVDEGDAPGITSPDYVVMTAVEGVLHPRWFYHWFRSEDGAAFVRSLTRGAVRERLLFKRLAPAVISVPPYPSQVRAAEIIRAAITVRQQTQTRLATLDRLPAALLRQVFGDADAKEPCLRP